VFEIASLIFVFISCILCGLLYICPLRWPHKKKSGGESLGDLRGHSPYKINQCPKIFAEMPWIFTQCGR